MKFFTRFFSLLAFVFIFGHCKKGQSPDETQRELVPEALYLWENVHVMDSAKYTLDLNSSSLGNGTYKFTFTSASPVITSGDIIIGIHGNGYIRKVSSVTLSGSLLTL